MAPFPALGCLLLAACLLCCQRSSAAPFSVLDSYVPLCAPLMSGTPPNGKDGRIEAMNVRYRKTSMHAAAVVAVMFPPPRVIQLSCNLSIGQDGRVEGLQKKRKRNACACSSKRIIG